MTERRYPNDWAGYCPICARNVTFSQLGPWLRDELVCKSCYSIPRLRALMHVLTMVRPDWQKSTLWELAPAGPSSARLASGCSGYIGTQYWPDVVPGAMRNGVRCEDIENPSFADSSVDIMISSDVFEHVFDTDRAMRQIARVLKADGVHIWTTPQYNDLEVSRERVLRRPDGELDYFFPAEFHGDPVNEDGALVTFDWGRDLPARVLRVSGLHTVVYRIESSYMGILGEFIEVFVSSKNPQLVDLAMRSQSGQTIGAAPLTSVQRYIKGARVRARPLKATYRRVRKQV